MAELRALKAVLSATVQVPDAAFERHSPFSPQDIGAQLATQIDAYVRSASLGYYPALDYFQKEALLDASLFEILDQLAWLGTCSPSACPRFGRARPVPCRNLHST